jgi:predicted transcriptional regulator of viral defense system
MTGSEVLARLRGLRVPAVTTADAAAVLRVSIVAASHALQRFGEVGLVTAVRKGVWALQERPDPMVLAEYVTAPYQSYVSLHSALYQHGMIDQIPDVTYLVSLGRSSRVETGIGTYSIHHVAPTLFGGFAADARTWVKLASPEKALVDFLYLSPTRTGLFAALPEVTLPARFRVREARAWIGRISSARLRTITTSKLDDILRRGSDQ